jgi:Fe2+ transport system protein FeoA
MKKFILQKIELPNNKTDKDLIQRFYDLGLHPGLEIEIVSKISFNSITIIRYRNTTMALNQEEFSCLHGH